MNRTYSVAIAGATGAVGAEMLQVLEERRFPLSNLKLLASSRSAGKRIEFGGRELVVEELCNDSFKGVDIVLFSAGGALSRKFRDAVTGSGAVMIDNSSAFRMDDDVPLVIPEVNGDDLEGHRGVIANPNCSTTILLIVLAPLHRAKKLRRIVASTYQAASGAGAKAMQELIDQTRQVLEEKPITPQAFAHRIAFNLIPHIDAFQDNGYTREELKMLYETRKMLHVPDLQVSCTCVRVPVVRAHSEALNLEFENPITADEARELLSAAPGVKVVDDPAELLYPMPIDASGKDDVLVGRIRQDISRSDGRGLDIFISGDQILKGAALNAVQIAEALIERNLLKPTEGGKAGLSAGV